MTLALFPAFAALALPKVVFLIGLVVVLVTGIAEFRQGYIGRVAIFANAILLWQLFFSVFGILPIWFQWYLNVGSIVGLIAIIAYFPKWKLPTEFYQICFVLYGSVSVIVAVIISFLIKVPLV
jgi:hypothetical protein